MVRCHTASVLCLAIGMCFAAADVVEEETWYNAGGEVVKTVKRTFTGADADRTPDWEPAWVIRERQRQVSSPVRRYYSARRSYWGSYGRRCGFFPVSSTCGSGCGYLRHGGYRGYYGRFCGGSSWGLGYRSSGLTIRYCR
ncbi:MAG: hypothetical protein HKN82_04555 [Akkermansiaceae bacterium]|nr:hypothetical protein [Akkermansiaceae bacterium]